MLGAQVEVCDRLQLKGEKFKKSNEDSTHGRKDIEDLGLDQWGQALFYQLE